MVEEVSDEAEVRQSSSSLLSAAASFRRPALTVAVLGAAAVIVVVARHTLAESLHVLAAASPGWLLLALAAEAVSLTAFGMSRRLLLRVNGHRIGLGPVMAITYAAHALGLSVPFAGAELDVVYSYRQFRRAGLDAATTSWSMAVSWICSTASLALLLVAGAMRFDRMRALLRSLLERLAALSKRASGKPEDGEAGVDRFLDEVSSRRLSLPGYGRVFGLALANWAFDGAVLALSIRAMGQPVPWDDLLLVYGAGAAVASTGLTPGGFALVELAMTAALTASGLHSSAALAAVVAYRFISFWLVLLGGWVAFIVLAHPLRRRWGR
ncbi:lysylphosphatidylglycerol synthase transmembrane domain-containing protein [Trebonia sp.]|uniref:lysylphosphatidylglycerol synthase transmembrane domain-containing protein n=1 Tax=Trebonia sp. TaxID=2767075 RepID=UPI003BB1DC39